MGNELSTTTTANGFALAALPGSPDAAYALCEKLAHSNLIPKAFFDKPGDIFVAGAMGARLGLDIFSALGGIAVVNGRPTLWGDAMLAVCQQRADFLGMAIEWSGEGEAKACSILVHRKGHAAPYVGKFSVADAKRAGLWGKAGPWTQYPERMIELRARAFALRTAFADALSGFHAREEMDDAEPMDVTASAIVRPANPEPARIAAPTSAAAAPAAADDRTAPTEQKATEQKAAKATKSQHPALIAARELYRNLGTHGPAILNRLAKLHGAGTPQEVAADRLEPFGKDVAELAASQGELAVIEDKLGSWEIAAREEREG